MKLVLRETAHKKRKLVARAVVAEPALSHHR